VPAPELRPERVEDHDAIGSLLRWCFPDERVDALVAALRAGSTYRPGLALVAPDEAIPGGLAGFVMLTTAPLEPSPWRPGPEGRGQVLLLSPLAVHPAATGRGIARALVERALALAAERSREPFVVLEGDPALYRRWGFREAREVGLLAPDERVASRAFQAHPLPWNGSRPAGQVLYPEPFGEFAPPVPVHQGVGWLDELQRQCRTVEQVLGEAIDAATGAQTVGGIPIAACPGWTVTDVLTHLAKIQLLVRAWLVAGRRPRKVPPPPAAGAVADPLTRFGRGWRALHVQLAAAPPQSPAATWSPWDATNGFWRRRMAHEHAMHALDLLDALGRADRWTVAPEVGADGVDEALRLWLGTRLGDEVGGRGDAVRLVVLGDDGEPSRTWVVVLHAAVLEVLEGQLGDGPVEAEVRGSASELYRWVWGRGGQVRSSGEAAAVDGLQRALARGTR